jgi:hypothetical protein
MTVFGAMFLSGILLAAIGFIGLLAQTPPPRFQVGDCIGIPVKLEHWQKRVVMRIEEVGDTAYRIKYRADDGTWYTTDDTLRFTSERFYEKVPCGP